MGMPDPHIEEALASEVTRPAFFKDSSCHRGFDPYGNSLSLYMGSGHGRTKFHNEIQRELYFLARSAGMGISETPTNLFLQSVLPRNRPKYTMAAGERLRRHMGNFNGGVVPDLYVTQSQQMLDVKTTGFITETYYGRRSAVDEKAATVPGQYRARAKDTDAAFNETTPETAPGPVETQLASMKQVICISVGAFGEVNRATSTFLNEIAETGSKNPERFGCCHGSEQAKGVIAQWAMRRLGRVCLRGTIRARHRALAVVTSKREGPLPRASGGWAEAP
jgi:hypothetical protein